MPGMLPAPPLPPSGSRLIGSIKSYNPEHGYGFIRCPELWEGNDVHFSRSLLPPEVQDRHWSALAGMPVEFELLVNRDGKLRTERLWLLEPLPGGLRPGRAPAPERTGSRRGGAPRDGPPPPDLDEQTVEEMTRFLEEKGGAMDHGKFANAFPGVKKSQLEPHFVLTPEGNAGGRWQVTLPGVEPLSPEEREARERLEADEREERRLTAKEPPPEPPLVLEPSATLRLCGFIKKWDRKRGYGFVVADGASNVFLHRNDLPPEVRSWRGDFEGAEVTFALDASQEGKLKAVDVHLLLVPDSEGRWQLRRSAAPEDPEGDRELEEENMEEPDDLPAEEAADGAEVGEEAADETA